MGSSMVMMWPERVRFTWSSRVASVVLFPAPVVPETMIRPSRIPANWSKLSGSPSSCNERNRSSNRRRAIATSFWRRKTLKRNRTPPAEVIAPSREPRGMSPISPEPPMWRSSSPPMRAMVSPLHTGSPANGASSPWMRMCGGRPGEKCKSEPSAVMHAARKCSTISAGEFIARESSSKSRACVRGDRFASRD